MIYFLIFLIGFIATACSLTGAILIGIQENQDFADRQAAIDQKDAAKASR